MYYRTNVITVPTTKIFRIESHFPHDSQHLHRESEIIALAVERKTVFHCYSTHSFQHCCIKITCPWLSQYSEGDNILRRDILLQQGAELEEPSNGFCEVIALQLEKNKYEKYTFIKILVFINIYILDLNIILWILMGENWVVQCSKHLLLVIYFSVNTIHSFYVRMKKKKKKEE